MAYDAESKQRRSELGTVDIARTIRVELLENGHRVMTLQRDQPN